MKITLYTILKQISELETEDAIIDGLRKSNPVVRQLLQYAFHPGIKFMLPSGTPPYKPCEFLDLEGRLLSEMRKLYLFVEGGNPNLSTLKRETLFIQLLESVDKNDAVLLCHVKNKKLPFKELNAKVVAKAFPGLLPEVTNE